jgi:hypothetical protein
MPDTENEYREEFSEASLKSHTVTYKALTVAAIALGAILFRVYVPRWISYLSYLQLPLLATVYFSLMRRSPVAGVLYGATNSLTIRCRPIRSACSASSKRWWVISLRRWASASTWITPACASS